MDGVHIQGGGQREAAGKEAEPCASLVSRHTKNGRAASSTPVFRQLFFRLGCFFSRCRFGGRFRCFGRFLGLRGLVGDNDLKIVVGGGVFGLGGLFFGTQGGDVVLQVSDEPS